MFDLSYFDTPMETRQTSIFNSSLSVTTVPGSCRRKGLHFAITVLWVVTTAQETAGASQHGVGRGEAVICCWRDLNGLNFLLSHWFCLKLHICIHVLYISVIYKIFYSFTSLQYICMALWMFHNIWPILNRNIADAQRKKSKRYPMDYLILSNANKCIFNIYKL